jgi:N-acetylglucosaminyldiphosphoundecaprenol N-acetyl-beta-D-mannosaminyltransferase
MDSYPRCNLLGVQVSAINMQEALEIIQGWIERGEQQYVCVVPAHSIMDAYHQPELRPLFNAAGLCTPDGMGVVWLLKWYGYPHVSRVYGPDLMLAVCERSLSKGWSHFFYGGAPGIAERLVECLQARLPGLQVAGVFCPPFGELSVAEERQVVEQINASAADIVWVGISSPKQERWMAKHRQSLQAPVLIGVGAAFDFLSGAKPQAPRWMQRNGFEWLYRFIHEPRRLWRRYIQYPLFIILIAAQRMGILRFPQP